ncbi:MAG: DUF2029 domain-containing protein [Flavobacteriales bacterium]|nr:DUF2029 domain-containing protein [Flavobacteriales bacterium]
MQDRFAWPLMCWWLVLAAAVVVVRTLSEGILDTGDGIMHFLFARNAPQHPEVFLDPWAKPLFTFLSAPFAQLGLWGMTLFNALCFVGTAWAADGILKHSALAARWLFAPALLLMPEYGNMVQAGMTEVLFAMVAMMAARFLWEERWRQAAVLISLLPFARPEYVAVLPFFVGWLLWNRQWRALPWLLFGHGLHALAAWVVLGDPLWAIHSPSYGDASDLYGRGYLMFFVDRLNVILGPGTEWLLVLSIPLSLAMVAVWHGERTCMLRAWALLLMPFLAIFIGHSLLWWQGWKASLGLVRVITTGAPLALLFVAWTLGRAGLLVFKTSVARTVLSVLASVLFVAGSKQFMPKIIAPGFEQRALQAAGEELKRLDDGARQFLVYHPMLTYAFGIDPFDRARSLKTSNHDDPEELFSMPEGAVVAWDPHMAGWGGGTPLPDLLESGRFDVKYLQVPFDRVEMFGQPYEVWFFERKDTRYERTAVSLYPPPATGGAGYIRLDTLDRTCDMEAQLCFDATEFPFDLSELPMQATGLAYAEVRVEADLITNGATASKMLFVLSEENDAGKLTYWTFPIKPGWTEFAFRVPKRTADVKAKFYLWNTSGSPFALKHLRVELTRIIATH